MRGLSQHGRYSGRDYPFLRRQTCLKKSNDPLPWFVFAAFWLCVAFRRSAIRQLDGFLVLWSSAPSVHVQPRQSMAEIALAVYSKRLSGKKLNPDESFMIQERWPNLEGPPMWTNENRARYDRSHLRYPSDLTDDEWQLVEPLIPPGRRGGDKRTVIMREVVNGLMYILSTGCQWRAIPKDLPPRATLDDYFDLWSWDRTLDLIHHELYVKCREAIGREASPTAAVIDSQSVKSAEKGGLRLIRRATTQERRSRARSGIFSSILKDWAIHAIVQGAGISGSLTASKS